MRRAVLAISAIAMPLGLAIASDDEGTHGRVVRIEDTHRNRQARVPAGKFMMGVDPNSAQSGRSQCETLYPPAKGFTGANIRVDFCEDYFDDLSKMEEREVYLDAFLIDRFEVGVRDYRTCVAAGECDLDPLVAGDERYIRDEWPMVNVTWDEAQTYCRWKGGQLPTEAQWERAARGDNAGATWPWGDIEQPKDFNHGQPRTHAMREIERVKQVVPLQFFGDSDDSDGHALLAPSGSYVWGEGPYGTRDQAGNVAEWTADAWGATDKTRGYTGLPAQNPWREPASASQPRVVRGGSWRQPAFFARTNLRDPFNQVYDGNRRFSHVGFRCVRALPMQSTIWDKQPRRGEK